MKTLFVRQRGYLLLVATAMIVIVGLIAVSATYLFAHNVRTNSENYQANQALYAAEAGLQLGISGFANSGNTTACGTTSLTVPVSSGSISSQAVVTGITFSPSTATTLTSALSASATTIPVASASGYDTAGGIIYIDQEAIVYRSISGSSFISATRGAYGTTATTHVSGAAVGQYQCKLTSTATSPATPPTEIYDPYGKRILSRPFALQEGWLVGANFNNTLSFAHWNKPLVKQWNSATISLNPGKNMNAVSLLSYADGWAVGDASSNNLLMYHWDGSNWTKITSSTVINANLKSVYCNASNDCWAVGTAESNSAYPTVIRWNGSTWTDYRINSSAGGNYGIKSSGLSSYRGKTLNSVTCTSSSNCFAVGAVAASSNPMIFNWNGAAWSLSTLNSNMATNTDLNSVSCSGSSNCVTVGAKISGGTAFVATWSGPQWTKTTLTTGNGSLNAISCDGSGDCWAGGTVTGNDMFLMHYVSSTNTWSVLTSPISGNYTINGVKCRSYNDCWVVGSNALTMHWAGSAWTQYTVQGSFTNSQLYGIDFLGPSTITPATWRETF